MVIVEMGWWYEEKTDSLHLDVGVILVPGLPASFVETVLKFNFSFCPTCITPSGHTLWTSLVARVVKNLPAMQKELMNLLGLGRSPEKEMEPGGPAALWKL